MSKVYQTIAGQTLQRT